MKDLEMMVSLAVRTEGLSGAGQHACVPRGPQRAAPEDRGVQEAGCTVMGTLQLLGVWAEQ